MKSEIKKPILEKRDSLSEQEIMEKSGKIEEKLFNFNQYKNAKMVMFYVSFKSEVCTHEMIKNSLKSKKIIVPKILSHEIEPSLIIDFDSMISGKFGILEPIELMRVPYKNIDIVIVPATVFDLSGHRIGYGHGYYDKFLKKIKAVKVGLCFDFQIVEKLPREEHDIPVDLIVTEEKVVDCKKIYSQPQK